MNEKSKGADVDGRGKPGRQAADISFLQKFRVLPSLALTLTFTSFSLLSLLD